MRKKYLIAVLFVAACAVITAGCTSKQLTKGDGGAPAQNMSSAERQNMDNKNINSTGQQNANAETTGINNAGETSSEARKGKEDLEDIHFDFDKYNIRQNDRTILSRDAAYLLKHKRVGIVIEGNCDERGTAEYNMALGEKRADEAKKYLVNLGVETKRIKTVSYGSEKPLDPGHDEEAWAKNRRDHFAAN
ncbi:MAG TPA: peptidoglycan-associated lipoprotein Pal [Smithella sp.]|nr:peptidoglycan-associated lipoprotein Pal [Smithella sp.]